MNDTSLVGVVERLGRSRGKVPPHHETLSAAYVAIRQAENRESDR